MSKHTPGPWWVTDYGIRDAGGYIAHTRSVQRYEGQDERYAFEVAQRDADKHLIAAAPELLEALEELAELVESLMFVPKNPEPGSIGHKYKAAIAKARGQK